MGNHTPVYVDNVREHLTSPGQWYFDNAKQEVLYYPLEGQEMDGIEAILAVEETLVRHAGVENHGWSGVTFEFGTWLRPMQVSNRLIYWAITVMPWITLDTLEIGHIGYGCHAGCRLRRGADGRL